MRTPSTCLPKAPSESYGTLQGAMRAIGQAGCGVVVYLDRREASATQVLDRWTGRGARGRNRRCQSPPGRAKRPGAWRPDLGGRRRRQDEADDQPPAADDGGLRGYGLEIVEEVAVSLPKTHSTKES